MRYLRRVYGTCLSCHASLGSNDAVEHFPVGRPLARLPDLTRLALEVAVADEVERRALEGELATLERAWRDAEEVAAIADSLLLPSGVVDRLRRLRSTDR